MWPRPGHAAAEQPGQSTKRGAGRHTQLVGLQLPRVSLTPATCLARSVRKVPAYAHRRRSMGEGTHQPDQLHTRGSQHGTDRPGGKAT